MGLATGLLGGMGLAIGFLGGMGLAMTCGLAIGFAAGLMGRSAERGGAASNAVQAEAAMMPITIFFILHLFF